MIHRGLKDGSDLNILHFQKKVITRIEANFDFFSVKFMRLMDLLLMCACLSMACWSSSSEISSLVRKKHNRKI